MGVVGLAARIDDKRKFQDRIRRTVLAVQSSQQRLRRTNELLQQSRVVMAVKKIRIRSACHPLLGTLHADAVPRLE